MKIKGTVVFAKNWEAINEMACNDDGTPFLAFDQNKMEWVHQRKYKYIINEGSSRSSKTISLIDCFDVYGRSNPNKRMTVWRDTKKICKDTVLHDALKHFRQTNRMNKGMILNKTESIITYSNNSTFEINGTDDEEKVHGFGQDVAWLNEPYKISKDTFDQIDQRTSDFIFIDWNPKKAHWIDELKHNKRAIIIKSTFKDNPFCPADQKYKIQSYQPLIRCYMVEVLEMDEYEVRNYDFELNPKNIEKKHLNEAKRCVTNEIQKSANAFNWSVYGLGEKAEKPNKIFSWDKCTNAEFDEIDSQTYYGCDWGTVDPWGIVAVKYHDGNLYVKELNYDCENDLRARLKPEMLRQIDTEDENIKDNIGLVKWMFQNNLKIPHQSTIICDNNRPKKIMALSSMKFRAFPTVKNSTSIVDGLNIMQGLNVFYTEDSDNIREEEELYSWEVDRYGLTMEKPEDKNNHLIDAIRYVVLYLVSKKIIRIV